MWKSRLLIVYRCGILRSPFALGLCFVLASILFQGSRSAQAETMVEFLSETFEGRLVPGDAGVGYKTKNAIEVLVHNKGTAPIKISFCAVPKGQDACPSQDVIVSILADKKDLLPDGRFELGNDQIKPLKLQLEFPASQAQTVTPGQTSPAAPNSGLAAIEAGLRDADKTWKEFVENRQPEAQTGQLILLADGAHAAAIPYTLTPEVASPYWLDKLTAEQVIVVAFVLSFLAVLLPVVTFLPLGAWARRIFPGYFQADLSPGALWTLPMGKAEWKLEDSWVVNLSVAITILGGIQSILPDSLNEFKSSYSTLIFLFGVVTAVAAFAYNAFTQPGPEKEEGKDTYKKQGRTGFFLVTSLFVVWALLGQFGLQAMAVERLRDTQSDIPGEFLIVFEVGVYIMTAIVFASTMVTLRRTILEQKIEAHKQAYRQNAIYRDKVQRIRRYAAWWMGILGVRKNLSEKDVHTMIEEFGWIVPLAVPQHLAGEEELRDRYQRFSELFHVNLPALVRSVAKDQKAARELFLALTDDALEAENFLKQTLPLEEVVAAFYSSLWAPRELRKKSYLEALQKLRRHLKVACAQARSKLEPDRIIGPNEELSTNITSTLAELDKALGLAGKRDPLYANLKKLLELAKLKWDEMEISELRITLCPLSTRIEQCSKNIERYFEKQAHGDLLGADLAKSALQPLATALGEVVPYPKPFPVDTRALEEAYTREESDVAKAKESLEEAKAKAYQPKAGTSKRKSTSGLAASASLLKAELQNLQKSINAVSVSPYSDSASDMESRQQRIKGLRQSGQQKVLGEDVPLL